MSSSSFYPSATIIPNDFSKVIPPIRLIDAVEGPSSKFTKNKISTVLDGLKLNDPEYTFEQISKRISQTHPLLMHLFDQFHFFVNQIGGMVGKGTDAFWDKKDLQGKRYLVDMVRTALKEQLSSVPLSEIFHLPFSKQDLKTYILEGINAEYFSSEQKGQVTSIKIEPSSSSSSSSSSSELSPEPTKPPKSYGLQMVEEFIEKVNADNKNYKLIIPRKNIVGEKEWADFDNIDIFIDAVWQNVHLIDLVHPMMRIPTELSVTKWIDQIGVNKDVDQIQKLLSGNKAESAEYVNRALLKATVPAFSAAFIEAMNHAKRKYPSINVLDRRFIRLITDDIPFQRLVADIYLRNTINSSKFTSTKSILDHRTMCATSISTFLKSSSPGLSMSSPISYTSNNAQDFFPQPKSILNFLIP